MLTDLAWLNAYRDRKLNDFTTYYNFLCTLTYVYIYIYIYIPLKMETSAIGGSAHLVNFKGSDTLPSIEYIHKYYGPTSHPAFSVNASEHSIMTAKGEKGHTEVLEALLKRLHIL